MDIGILTTNYANLLKKAVDVHDKQHKAIAQNVANVNTAKYERINTNFSEQLQSAMNRSGVRASRENHIQHSNWNKASTTSGQKNSGGSVDLAREMTDLSVNQIRFEFVTRSLARYYSGISTAIVGRNR